MGSIAQSFKQLNDRLDIINSTNTQTFKQMNDRLDRIESTNTQIVHSVQKTLIILTDKVDKQEAMCVPCKQRCSSRKEVRL